MSAVGTGVRLCPRGLGSGFAPVGRSGAGHVLAAHPSTEAVGQRAPRRRGAAAGLPVGSSVRCSREHWNIGSDTHRIHGVLGNAGRSVRDTHRIRGVLGEPVEFGSLGAPKVGGSRQRREIVAKDATNPGGSSGTGAVRLEEREERLAFAGMAGARCGRRDGSRGFSRNGRGLFRIA